MAEPTVAIVTGGASGIGFGIARRLARDGYRVAILDIGGYEEAAADIVVEGGWALGFGADVTNRDHLGYIYGQIREKLGPIAIVVTSAGIDSHAPFLETSAEAWDRVIAVNLTGTFHAVQLALPDMVGAGWGRIITIAATSGQTGGPMRAGDAAAKAGVIGLTKTLALEYARSGITANAIAPTITATPMSDRAQERGELPPYEEAAAAIPVGRVGTPDDMAAVCSFLCRDEASFITGQQLNANGGGYL